ncbi:unnamed protein product [Trichogramma brassicae]|uniref:Retrotransposon gag domain-containing protein n=1 Tax=Trichogramma brassicae TaxID=86971 RepID=A0A6H5IB59_9HYME|nr:unnamed protein product [Trichogramma brassicae]
MERLNFLFLNTFPPLFWTRQNRLLTQWNGAFDKPRYRVNRVIRTRVIRGTPVYKFSALYFALINKPLTINLAKCFLSCKAAFKRLKHRIRRLFQPEHEQNIDEKVHQGHCDILLRNVSTKHLIEPNAIKSSKHTDKVRAPSTWTPMKPCKTPRVKSQPENMTATHGWNPAMHTLNRTDHTTSAITESREEEVMGSHALPMQPATRRRVSTTHRPSSSVGHRHDDADVNNSMQTDRTAASHRAVFKPRTYAYNKVPSSSTTPFELYSRDTRSQRLPSTNRSRAQPLRRVINYPDVDETDRDESRVPVRISSRDSRNQPSTFEPKLGNRSSLHHKGHFVSGKASAVKLLKSWGLKFSGEDKQEDAEDFLDQLNKCVDGAGLAVADILSALPCIFSKRAARWHGTVADRVNSWSEFEAEFRNQFIGEYDYWDLMTDLQGRTQGRGERITPFLSCFRYIVSRFSEPPSERELLTIAYRNLLPEYRHAMADKSINNFEQLEKLGRSWERKKDIDNRYAPPVPAENMRVPGGAHNAHF